MRNTAAIWYKKSPLRRTISPTKRSPTKARRSKLFLQITILPLSPASYLMPLNKSSFKNPHLSLKSASTLTAIVFPAKFTVAAAKANTSLALKGARMGARTAYGGATAVPPPWVLSATALLSMERPFRWRYSTSCSI